MSLLGSLINHVPSHNQQVVSETPLCLCQAVSSIMSHPMTNRWWVTCFTSFSGSLINHVSSHEKQCVSDTASFLWEAASSILTNHITSHDQQGVSDTALFLGRLSHQSCLIQVVSTSDTDLFSRQSHQSYLIPWPTGCEWHCFIFLQGSLINHALFHDQQVVSGTALFFLHHLTTPWPTDCMSYEVFHQAVSCLLSCDQQSVSDMPSFPVVRWWTYYVLHEVRK